MSAPGGGRRAAGGSLRPGPRPMAPSRPSQAPATTATAATRTGTRAGPGVTSAARPAPPKSGRARTRAAQVPTRDPRARRRGGAAVPAGPAPSDWSGLSPGRGARSPLAAAAPSELRFRERLVNSGRGRGPAGGRECPAGALPRTWSGAFSGPFSLDRTSLWVPCCVLSSAHNPPAAPGKKLFRGVVGGIRASEK